MLLDKFHREGLKRGRFGRLAEHFLIPDSYRRLPMQREKSKWVHLPRATTSMNRFTKRSWIGIILLVVLTPWLFADSNSMPDWQTIRDHQPAKMQLKLSLPKDHFFLGEEIPATLIFPYDRTNYSNGYCFYGFDEKNKPLVNSIYAWCMNFDPFLYKHQFGNYNEPAPNSVVTSINQLYSFNHTGTYTIFVTTAQNFGGNPPASLVSNKVTFTIDPITPADEEAVLQEARALFAKPESSDQDNFPAQTEVFTECNKLWFLGTPAALKELAPFLEEGCNGPGCAAAFAFGVPPDRKASAALLLDCVKKGKPLLNQLVVYLYTYLEGGSIYDGLIADLNGVVVKPGLSDRQKEIIHAALDASGGKGPIAASAYWAALRLSPQDEEFRKEVTAHQMDLSRNDRQELVARWNGQLSMRDTLDAYKDLVPAVEKTADAPEYDPQALELLSKVAPNRARPLVIADIKRDTSLYYTNPHIHYPNPIGDEALPDQPIPELTETFRQKLRKPYVEDSYLLTLVNRYGTPDLLPDVEAFYQQNLINSKVICSDQIAYRSFSIRCNSATALASLESEIESRKEPRFNDWILQVFDDRWNDAALPFIKNRVNQETYPDALFHAIRILEAHSDSTCVEPAITALERISKQKYLAIEDEPTPANEKCDETNLIQSIEKSGHWSLTSEQRERLNKLIDAK